MNMGLSWSSSIFWSAFCMIASGSSFAAMVVRSSKASLFSWYPAVMVVSTAFWSFCLSLMSLVFLRCLGAHVLGELCFHCCLCFLLY